MTPDNLNKVAAADAKAISAVSSIGYAVSMIMDYGNGRQLTIAGTMPLNATLQDFNGELDKLRLATDRQKNLVIRGEVENTLMMARKNVNALKLGIETYNSTVEKEIERLSTGEDAKHTRIKAQVENTRAQAVNYKLTKEQELLQAESDVAKAEAVLAKIDKDLQEG